MSRTDRGSRIAGAVLAAVLLVPGAQAAEEGQAGDELKRIEREIEAGRDRRQDLDREASTLRRDVEGLRRALIAGAAAAQRQEDAVAGLEERLRRLTAERETKSAVLARRRAELTATLSALLRLSRRPPEVLIARPASAVDAVRSSLLLGAVVPKLEARAATLRRELVTLASLRESIAARKAELGNAHGILAKERRELDRLLKRKASLQERTEKKRSTERERLARLANEAQSLRALIDRLAAESRARRAAERRAAAAREEAAMRLQKRRQAAAAMTRPGVATAPPRALTPPPTRQPAQQPAPQPAPQGAPQGAPPSARQPPQQLAALAPVPSRPFSEARGTLPLPARGRIVRRYGQNTEFGTPAKGITIETLPLAQVIAPHDGRVVFSGVYRDYGQLLIIEHGEGYHTLLAGLSRIDGRVGQWLLAGEPVGQMGAGSGRKPVLYVELRRNGEPMNPLPWLAAKERRVSG